jgi:hypothetical protein
MVKFIKFLQIIFAVAVVVILGYDLVLHGVTVLNEKMQYVILIGVLWAALEIALFVINKLIEDD